MDSDDSASTGLEQALYWGQYEKSLRERNRFFLRDAVFFTETVKECLSYEFTIPAETEVYRARVVSPENHWMPEPLNAQDSGAPPKALARPGRLNPDGIVVFYAAREEETAIAELRPWRESRISVARFTLARSVRAVDLTFMTSKVQKTRRASWVGYQFGLPVHEQDPHGYLPTQYLAEKLESEGIEAVEYDSAMRPHGVNVALFAPSVAKFKESHLVEVTDVVVTSKRFESPKWTLPPLDGA